MWRTTLNRSIKELRFNLKTSPEHHGVWNWVSNEIEKIRMLNQNTFFVVHELRNNFETKSAVHVIYGDEDLTTDAIETEGLTAQQFEEILKSKVKFGLTLSRGDCPDLPTEIVETHKYVKYIDDGF